MFRFATLGPISVLVYEEWEARGIRHGFTACPADFGPAGRAVWAKEIAAALGVDNLNTLAQVHGVRCWSRPEYDRSNVAEPEGDAFLLEPATRPLQVWGVKAADCAPVLLLAGERRVLIHAGWRGLAGGVIGAVLNQLPADVPVECVVGPCAGPEGYAVGGEVIEALGEVASTHELGAGIKGLDVAATTCALIRRSRPDAIIVRTTLNTVTDTRFHSFRRDGASAGRGIGFFLA